MALYPQKTGANGKLSSGYFGLNSTNGMFGNTGWYINVNGCICWTQRKAQGWKCGNTDNSCGPSAVAIIVSSLTGTYISIDEILSTKAGMNCWGRATGPTDLANIMKCAYPNMFSWETGTVLNQSKVDSYLKNNGMVAYVSHGGGPYFTNNGGHWVVVCGKNSDGTYKMCDSWHYMKVTAAMNRKYNFSAIKNESSKGGQVIYIKFNGTKNTNRADATTTTKAIQPTKTTSLPANLGKYFTYMGWSLITAKSSQQYKLREKAGEHYDAEGFAIIDGRYVVAMTSTFGKIGDYVDVYQSNGHVFKCVIGDEKSQTYEAWDHNPANKWGHSNGQCVLEFVVNKKTWYNTGHSNPGTSGCHPEWGGKTITKVLTYGNYFDGFRSSSMTTSSGGGSSSEESEKKELNSTKIVSVTGTEGTKKDLFSVDSNGDPYELYIKNKKIYKPIIQDGVKWDTERAGTAGKLTFTVLKDSVIAFNEGDAVQFKVNGDGVFYGYVFSKKRDKDHHIQVTAYDQLRYFTNQSTYIFQNKRLDEIVQLIANDFKLTTGKMTNTGYVIPSQIEDNSSLFDMVIRATNTTFSNTGKKYLFYDDFGSLQLTDIAKFRFTLMINNETAENFDYETTIDSDVYNKIVLYKDNDDGCREMTVVQDGDTISRWGVLQLTQSYDEGQDPKNIGKTLLKYYDRVSRKLSIKGALGDIRVRAGSQIFISLNLGDLIMNDYMMVEKASHNFENNHYTMDLQMVKIGSFYA